MKPDFCSTILSSLLRQSSLNDLVLEGYHSQSAMSSAISRETRFRRAIYMLAPRGKIMAESRAYRLYIHSYQPTYIPIQVTQKGNLMALKHQYADINGIRLHYVMAGEGPLYSLATSTGWNATSPT